MNKLFRTLLITSLVSSFGAFAQEKGKIVEVKPTMIDNEKGNGGEYDIINKYGVESDFLRIRKELINFLNSDTALNLYPNIDLKRTIELLEDDEIFELAKENLVDKFNLKRDALNFPENLKVFLEEESFAKAVGTKAIYVLVLHEVFGLQGVEVNDAESSKFSYEESLKLWNYIHADTIYSLRDHKSNAYVISNRCDFEMDNKIQKYFNKNYKRIGRGERAYLGQIYKKKISSTKYENAFLISFSGVSTMGHFSYADELVVTVKHVYFKKRQTSQLNFYKCEIDIVKNN